MNHSVQYTLSEEPACGIGFGRMSYSIFSGRADIVGVMILMEIVYA